MPPALVVAIATLIAFLPTLQNEFVDWDDPDNFLENRDYRGLGWSQLRWMFTSFHMGHFTPLTWITLGLDHVVWGMDPRGYHLTSLMLHVATATVVYGVAASLLRIALGDSGISVRAAAAFAALLWAIHPLRVESVAWVTERRDVLSGLLYVSTLLAYLRFTESDSATISRRWYRAAIVLFALALLAKAMTMTLPVMLLLLDVYPLRRLRFGRADRASMATVLAEKIPFFALAAGAAVVAVLAQRQFLSSIASVGLADRLALSLHALVFYVGKTFAPYGLAPLYERPRDLNPLALPFVLSAAAAVFVTALVIVRRRRWPALAGVWAAYVVTVGPVIGLVHAGPQIAADRYTYLPGLWWALLVAGIGLRIWLGARTHWQRHSVALFGCAVLIGIGGLTWQQTRNWHDAESLWSHAIGTRPSYMAHNNLGVLRFRQGRTEDAIGHYQQALMYRDDVPARINLGVALDAQGRAQDAAEQYRAVLVARPSNAIAHQNLGMLLARDGRWAEATEHYRAALREAPAYVEAHINLGVALNRLGDADGALAHFWEAVRIRPEDPVTHNNLGIALARRGSWTEAVTHFREALRLNPDYGPAAANLRNAPIGQTQEGRPR